MSDKPIIEIRNFQPSDARFIVELNQHSVAVLSPMDEQRLQLLHNQSSLLWIAEVEQQPAGFLMAFCEGSHYDSVNYQWFNQRYDNFVYIDRVVVTAAARGRGIGSAFYSQLNQWAQQHHKDCLTAEVDIIPPNPGSLNFHKRQGFKSVAEQVYGDPEKKVSLLEKKV